jgi:GNAT superfamily N-acetyltransferase
MADMNGLQFTRLDKTGLQTLVSWAAAEGWNPGPYDADVFWATDPEGFYGCFDDGELVGGGSIVSYGGQFGFMGFFIVKPEYRARGIGRMLWYKRRDTLLARLDEGAAIGMDGVVDMQPFYAKGGFVTAFRDERYERMGEPLNYSDNISPITEVDTDALLAYDALCFGLPRPQFMKPWLRMPGNKMFKYMEDGTLKGFAILRKAQQGNKVCPLFADSGAIAEALYRACLNAVAGEPLYLDIPVTNTDAVNLVKNYNATYVFECARMYYGKPPAMDINKVFGITSFELG